MSEQTSLRRERREKSLRDVTELKYAHSVNLPQKMAIELIFPLSAADLYIKSAHDNI